MLIGDVIFPLRYDIVAQAPFVALYHGKPHWEMDDLLVAGRSLLVETHIALVHEHERELIGSEPLLAKDRPVVFERYYRARIEKLAGLCDSLEAGWDYEEDAFGLNQPGKDGLTSMGNPVPPGHFLANGQHRMIVLYGMGRHEMDPRQYTLRVPSSDFVPLETTGAYVKAGLVTEEQFVKFARLRLPVPAGITRIGDLATWAHGVQIEWLLDYIKLYWEVDC